jgi:serine/threonine protein phosphatase 1
MAIIKKLPENRIGRDFVVGDLHGCRELLDQLLEQAHFDPAADRLFSVGDLVDRDPDSMGCLRLLREPWFHAVLGNHEAMLLDHVLPSMLAGVPFAERRRSLFNWAYGFYDQGGARWQEGFAEAVALLAALPRVIIVGEGEARFHVVHADLYDPGCPDELMRNADLDRLAEMASLGGILDDKTQKTWTALAERLVWSRHVFEGGLTEDDPRGLSVPARLEGLSTTYCGHTLGRRVRAMRSHVCLDTGAWLSYYAEGEPGDALSLLDTRNNALYAISGRTHDETVRGAVKGVRARLSGWLGRLNPFAQ